MALKVNRERRRRRTDGQADRRPAADDAASGRLDQYVDNRKTDYVAPWRSLVSEGDLIAFPARSGGAFDPLGVRGVDVKRADDIVEVISQTPGRWMFVTLTVDRSLFLGPEHAYQRCNEYVRKAAAAISGLWVNIYEVQSKTGDGWPHWHLLIRCREGDRRSDAELKAAVESKWRTCQYAEELNRETGEVRLRRVSRERIGFVDVEEIKDDRGAAIYVSKYLMKPWPKGPAPWMLESRCRFRKHRCSSEFYVRLEDLGRHRVKHGSRQVRRGSGRPIRRTRKMMHRLACSGGSMQLFRVVPGGRLQWAGSVPVPWEWATAAGFEWLRSPDGGRLKVCRGRRLTRAEFEEWRGRSAEWIEQQRTHRFDGGWWYYCQHLDEREAEERELQRLMRL